ncbi:MAG: hypothetical protein IT372_15995 [Polyangiaceae bacterium]|nr:hypothetical protein [Polyangiaceae bacterium]
MSKKRRGNRAAAPDRARLPERGAAPPDASDAARETRQGGDRAMGTTSGRADLEAGTTPKQGVTTGNLEQVREILFGPQLRDLARRLARTDAHVAAQADELRRRLDVLEIHVRNESEALGARLEAQRAAEADALGSFARETRDSIRLLEPRVQRLEEVLARAQREFRQQLLEQAKAFIEEVGRARAELSATVEREIAVVEGEAPAPEEQAGAPEEAGRHEQREAA